MPANAERRLVAILRSAYSGERAAALAYRGHWRASRDPEERASLRRIEEDEWRHRRLVGDMLAGLGSAPLRLRDARAGALGRVLGALCHVSGWLLPMYAAGRLESGNVAEYEEAARCAAACGHGPLVPCLVEMAEVERDHERYFRGKVAAHAWGRWIPLWPPPAAADSSGGSTAAAPTPWTETSGVSLTERTR